MIKVNNASSASVPAANNVKRTSGNSGDVNVKLEFNPSKIGATRQRDGNYPPTKKITENALEAALLKKFGFDATDSADMARVRQLMQTEGKSPFEAMKTKGSLVAAYNNRTGKYEIIPKVEKNLYRELQGKAAEVKTQMVREKQALASNPTNPNEAIAVKTGITNNKRAELENKFNNQTTMSAVNRNESEKAVKSVTGVIEKMTGTSDPFAATEIGKQFNRLGVSSLRLGGKAMELSNYFSEKLNDAVRYIAPDVVDNLLNQADKLNRETAQSLQNAGSAATSEDQYIDAKAKQLGQEIPITEDLANKIMYFPEAIPNAIDSAVKGDFKDDDGSYSDKVGKIIGGLNPAGDVRDIVADGKRVADGEKGGWIKLGATILGAVPIVGDAGKALIKTEEKAIIKALEKSAEKEIVEVGEKVVEKEGATIAEKEIKDVVETEEVKNVSNLVKSEYKEVEIVDKMGKPIGEFDKIEKGLFVEDKSAKGLSTLHPKTGKPLQTAGQWAEKQIYEKSVVRIENLQNKAVATRATKSGSQVVPSLDEIKTIRKLQFRIEGDSPELRNAVEEQIKKLSQKYPNWEFSAEFGD